MLFAKVAGPVLTLHVAPLELALTLRSQEQIPSLLFGWELTGFSTHAFLLNKPPYFHE